METPVCRICGGKLYYDKPKKLIKKVDNHRYNLSVCQHCLLKKFPNIKNWAISGHSLGGVMAAKYASENSNIEGLILYASYPQGDELKDSDIAVTSIYGSVDGVANLEKVKGAKDLLPTSTTFVEIIGGNHAQFGSYGEQSGDNPAEISADEQIEQASKASIDLLNKISK